MHKQLLKSLLWVLIMIYSVATYAAETGHFVGVASCASGNCHGKLVAESRTNIQANEYRIWAVESRHARAFDTLLSPKSKQIVAALGLPSAQTAKLCLGCHSTPAPMELRTAGYSQSDGVSCEACHGAASGWLDRHRKIDNHHRDNLAAGMVALEDPLVRARRCVSCHVGDRERFADHDLMSAGHPRLIFELDAYSTNQPSHHTEDADYYSRKFQSDETLVNRLWLFGQLSAAQGYLETLSEQRFSANDNNIWPELALFDCHACHHPMQSKGRLPSSGILPGTLRLRDQHLQMLSSASRVLSPNLSSIFNQEISKLHNSISSGTGQRQAIDALSNQLEALANHWHNLPIDHAMLKAIRSQITKRVAARRILDFGDAAQAYLAIDSLSIRIGDRVRLEPQLKRLFEQVADDEPFNAESFLQATQELRSMLHD